MITNNAGRRNASQDGLQFAREIKYQTPSFNGLPILQKKSVQFRYVER